MKTHTIRLKPAVTGHAFVNPDRLANIDAELVLAQAGRDVGMSLCENVGIHAQGNVRLLLEFRRARGQQFQLRLALHVEREDSCPEREIDLRRGLAYAGVDHPTNGLGRGSHYPLQLPARHDIETRSTLRQQLQNRQRRVSLDRVTDQIFPTRQRLLKHRQPLNNLIRRIDIKRRVKALCQLF